MVSIKNLFSTRALAGPIGLVAVAIALGITRFQLPATGLRFSDYVLEFLVVVAVSTCSLVVTNLILMLRQNRRRRTHG